MQSVLLGTKLAIPAPVHHMVTRSALLQRLDEGLQGARLTLVSAPAGYGKTTLLAQWLRRSNRPSAWLSLDEHDDDPARFFVGLLSAARQVDRRIGIEADALLGGPNPPSAQTFMAALIAGVEAVALPFVLVLDDYQLVTDAAIHEAVRIVVERCPQIHLVVATRADPSLPLAGWRAQGRLSELRASDLRFTQAESATFLRSALGRPVSNEDAAALADRTEGWVAGLQLAAPNARGAPDTSGLPASLSGGHPYLAEYLTE